MPLGNLQSVDLPSTLDLGVCSQPGYSEASICTKGYLIFLDQCPWWPLPENESLLLDNLKPERSLSPLKSLTWVGGQAAHFYLTVVGHGAAAEPRVTAFKVENHSSQGGCEERVSPEPCYKTLSPNKVKWHVYDCGKHSQFLGGMVGWAEKENRISNYCENVYIEITCSVSGLHLKYSFFFMVVLCMDIFYFVSFGCKSCLTAETSLLPMF